MKPIFVVLFAVSVLLLSGCPDLQKFANLVDESSANWEKASEELLVLSTEVKGALEAYQKVLASGDTDAIAKARAVLVDAQARYESKEAEVAVVKEAVDASIKQYEDAKKESNYWWTIPGLLLGGVLGGLGIRTKLAPVVSAFTKTVNNVRALGKDQPKAVEEFKDAQAGALTPAEKKAIAKVLGKS
jgi:hypothetical protein